MNTKLHIDGFFLFVCVLFLCIGAFANPSGIYFATEDDEIDENYPPNDLTWNSWDVIVDVTVPPELEFLVGLVNHDPENKKKGVSLLLKGSNLEGLTSEAYGYRDSGQTLANRYSAYRNDELPDPDGDGKKWFSLSFFEPNPQWEIFTFVNEGDANALITDIVAFTFCFDPNDEDTRYGLENFGLGPIGKNVTITKCFIYNESETMNSAIGPQLEVYDSNSIWTADYVTEDPNTAEAVPQGGWLFTCTSGDGITTETVFNLHVSMEACTITTPYFLSLYDLLSGQWVLFELPNDEESYRPADLNRDCIVSLPDLALLADEWLQKF